MRTILIMCFLLSGCELIDTRNKDERDLTHGCVMEHADGTIMSCNQKLQLNKDEVGSDHSVGKQITVP